MTLSPLGVDAIGGLSLSATDLERLCDFLYRRTGMLFGESKRYYIARRLAERMVETATDTFSAYFAYLRTDALEAERLVNSFTVNETYFYREDHQLRCMTASLLPAIVAKRNPGDRVRIWSVPCSTGEEPYSIAIWLLENWAMVDAYNIEIVGSDIDTRVLDDARRGEYGERALSRLPGKIIADYFEPLPDGKRRIIQDLKESVAFRAANLVDAATTAPEGLFDIIFCRNVLIYFDEASRILAARNIYASLNPGGFACLGHSESMTRIVDSFVVRRFDDALVYQRPEETV
ncbi:MAG: protein-glutamate O-methyltransferase CheR [Methylocella sp.]